jgi:hypothetical protein
LIGVPFAASISRSRVSVSSSFSAQTAARVACPPQQKSIPYPSKTVAVR